MFSLVFNVTCFSLLSRWTSGKIWVVATRNRTLTLFDAQTWRGASVLKPAVDFKGMYPAWTSDQRKTVVHRIGIFKETTWPLLQTQHKTCRFTYRELDSQLTENLKSVSGRVGKQVGNGGCNKTHCPIQVTWPIPRPPGMCEKNILLLFRFSQPVEKNTYFINRLDCSFSS